MKNKRNKLLHLLVTLLMVSGFYSCHQSKCSNASGLAEEIYINILKELPDLKNFQKIMIDTLPDMIFNEKDRMNLYNFDARDINFIVAESIFHPDVIKNAVSHNYPDLEIVFDGGAFVLLDIAEQKIQLKDHNAVWIRLSRIYKNEFSNDHFFMASWGCGGSRCGGAVFVHYRADEDHKLVYLDITSY